MTGAGSDSFTMRERACPLCGQRSQTQWLEQKFDPAQLDGFAFASRKLPELMRFPLALCRECDLVYASQVPDLDWIRAGYRDAGFDAARESSLAAEAYARQLARGLPPAMRRDSALDIGCGDGAFLRCLREMGFTEVTGIEPSEEPIRQAPPDIRNCIRNEFFGATRSPDASFDLVTCFQTLEHTESPLELCIEACRLLRPGGVLFVADHDFRALPAHVLGALSPIYDIEHLQLFSRRSLARLFALAGFADVEILPLRNSYPLTYWVKLFPLPRLIKMSMLSKLERSSIGQWRLSARMGNLTALGIRR